MLNIFAGACVMRVWNGFELKAYDGIYSLVRVSCEESYIDNAITTNGNIFAGACVMRVE